VPGLLALHVARRQAVQFLVNERGQDIEGPLVAASPRDEQFRDIRDWTHQGSTGGVPIGEVSTFVAG
jgi:hypothetical protein